MSSFSNFTTKELMNVARLRNLDGYKNMSKQQLEKMFTTSSESIPIPIPISRSRPLPRPRPRRKLR